MNLNQNIRLSELPKVNISRSKFDRSHKHTTTFNTGRLIPIYLSEVVPGQTSKLDTSSVVRLQTLLKPLMDNIYMDTYFFFVPARLCWDHWQNFMGENSDSAWIPDVEYHVPQLVAPTGGFSSGSLADYFGLPIGVSGLSVNALPFRAYAQVVNDWFIDQNLQTPLPINKGDAPLIAYSSSDASYDDQITCIQLGGAPFIAGKYHDVFSSALPYPQKHEDVSLPISGYVPVVPMPSSWSDADLTVQNFSSGSEYVYPTLLKTFTGDTGTILGDITTGQKTGINSSGQFSRVADTSFSSSTNHPVFSNLGANLGEGLNASINDLRMSLAIQRLYERDAMYGTRYTEVLLGQYGVRSADYRLQRSEFLGGDHTPLNISQVVQVGSQNGNTDFLGTVGGYSVTGKVHQDVNSTFTEHGYIIGLAVCRYEHSFQQALDKMWSREDRLDFYFPVFSEISNQPILKKEICATGTSTDDEVFGYQEAWYDYRYIRNMVTGEMRSNISNSLDVYHLADYYSSVPSLSASWIREDKTNVDRVLAVSSDVSNQIMADFYFKEDAILPLPVYSIPSLTDSFIK